MILLVRKSMKFELVLLLATPRVPEKCRWSQLLHIFCNSIREWEERELYFNPFHRNHAPSPPYILIFSSFRITTQIYAWNTLLYCSLTKADGSFWKLRLWGKSHSSNPINLKPNYMYKSQEISYMYWDFVKIYYVGIRFK